MSDQRVTSYAPMMAAMKKDAATAAWYLFNAAVRTLRLRSGATEEVQVAQIASKAKSYLGLCAYSQNGDVEVNLSPYTLINHVQTTIPELPFRESLFRATLHIAAHELGHGIVHKMYTRRGHKVAPHGAEWKAAMSRYFGIEANARASDLTVIPARNYTGEKEFWDSIRVRYDAWFDGSKKY
jgi:hypothetical protein